MLDRSSIGESPGTSSRTSTCNRAMIVDRVASSRPELALDLMWQFMRLADSVFTRVDDSNGTVGNVFRSACNDLATLASKAKPDPETLAERVFAAITDDGY